MTKKKIIMRYGEIGKIAKDFDVCRMTVYRALSYTDTGSAQSCVAEKLRQIALQRGGVYIEYPRQ